MRPTEAKGSPGRPASRFAGRLGALAFFVLFFLYVWLRIEPGLLLHVNGPLFFFSNSFWETFSSRPGGWLEYVAAFVAQADHFNWLGALVLTGVCFLIFLLSRRIVTLAGSAVPWPVLALPACLVLLWLNQYQTSAWNLALGLLLKLASAYGWLLVPRKWIWVRLMCCWGIAAAMCWIAGFWPCVSFLAVVALVEVARQAGKSALVCLLPGLLPPCWIVWSMGSHRAGFLNPWGPGPQLLLAVEARWSKTPRPAPPPTRFRTPAPASAASLRWDAPRLRPVVAAAILAVACLSVWFTFDEQSQLGAQIDYDSEQGNHQQVLASARRLKTISPATEVNLQFALWKQGQLLEQLLAFETPGYPGLFPGLSRGVSACRSQVRPLMEIGLINDAEHYGHEALENEGNRPDLLRQLAQINVLKGRPQAARVFLNVLREIPFEAGWPRAWLQRLDQDPALGDDSQLARIRPLMLTNDIGHSVITTGPLLQHLLRANRHNRMAFEYLTLHYLLNLNLEQVVELLPGLDDFGYAGIPRHCEEAVLLFQQLKNVHVELRGRKIRPETVARFQRFSEALRGSPLATPEGQSMLARDFGDTYWYYYLKHQADEPALN